MAEASVSSTEQPRYLSYLLRLWREGDGERSEWRASLRSTHSGEAVGLASLEDLYRFVHCQTGTTPNAEQDGQEP